MQVKEGINPEKLPVHIAIIMDGNGRWARQHAGIEGGSMKTPAPKSDDRSAQPIKGLSKRGQQLVKARSFGVYAKARPAEKK